MVFGAEIGLMFFIPDSRSILGADQYSHPLSSFPFLDDKTNEWREKRGKEKGNGGEVRNVTSCYDVPTPPHFVSSPK